MKKVLFATTALIASAGIAAADGHSSVTVGGFGFAGVKDDGTDTDVISKVRLTFAATVETDAGVTFGAAARMNISDNAKDADANALENGKVSMEAGGFKLVVGATNGAMRSLARQNTSYGFDDGGTMSFDNSDGGGNAFDRQADSENVVYASYTSNGFTVGVSANAQDRAGGDITEFGVQYKTGAYTVGVAANDDDDWMLGGAYAADGLAVEAGINNEDTVYLGVAYDITPDFEVAVAFQDADDGEDIGIQGTYDLGGAQVVGTFGENANDDSVASLGVIFSF